MTIDFSKRALIPRHVMFRELEGEAVVLNLESERYYGLDGVGTRIWVLLSNSETIEQAYQVISNEYDVQPDVLRQDMNHLVQELVQQGLVELA
jgi:hypothetical protein